MQRVAFTRAAEKLGLTSSAVSKRVSILEQHLNVKLLNRTTRKVALTEAGERYIEYAKEAYKSAQEAKNAATENENMPTGVLSVSAPVTFGHEVLAKLLPLFLQKYPQLNLVVELTDVFTKVKIEDFDVIFNRRPLFDSSYSATNLFIDEARVVASPRVSG